MIATAPMPFETEATSLARKRWFLECAPFR
jgi:hypothetical protein